MMRALFLSLTMAAGLGLSAGSAEAAPKLFYWSWWPGHFENMEFDRRYLETGKLPHNRQWDDKLWEPAVWIEQKRGGLRLVNGFYKAGIFTDQTVDDGVPYLHVGPQFYNLSGYDKRRVVETVDEVFGITEAGPDAVFYLFDDAECEVVGIYTRHGLQIQ